MALDNIIKDAANRPSSVALLRLIKMQWMGSCVLLLILAFFASRFVVVSASIGAVTAITANMYVAFKLRRKERVQQDSKSAVPHELRLTWFYQFEVVKILLTLALFFVAIVGLKVAFLPFIAAYTAVALGFNWLFFYFQKDL